MIRRFTATITPDLHSDYLDVRVIAEDTWIVSNFRVEVVRADLPGGRSADLARTMVYDEVKHHIYLDFNVRMCLGWNEVYTTPTCAVVVYEFESTGSKVPAPDSPTSIPV